MASAKCVLWLTGENGSGNDGLARALESQLKAKAYLVGVFDATHLPSRQPESSGQELEKQSDARLVNGINDLLMRDDVVIVAADAAPPSGLSEQVGRNTNIFIEVFIHLPAEACSEEDTHQRRNGEVPVEDASRIVMDAGADTLQGNVELIITRLEDVCMKQGGRSETSNDYSEEDEEIVRRRLEDLGYI